MAEYVAEFEDLSFGEMSQASSSISATIDTSEPLTNSTLELQAMPEIPSNITTKGHFGNTKQIATPGATPEPQIPEIESEEEEEDITIEGEMPLPLSTATQKQRNKQREQIPRAAKTQTDYKKLHTGKLNAYMMQKNILDFENLCLTAQKAQQIIDYQPQTPKTYKQALRRSDYFIE